MLIHRKYTRTLAQLFWIVLFSSFILITLVYYHQSENVLKVKVHSVDDNPSHDYEELQLEYEDGDSSCPRPGGPDVWIQYVTWVSKHAELLPVPNVDDVLATHAEIDRYMGNLQRQRAQLNSLIGYQQSPTRNSGYYADFYQYSVSTSEVEVGDYMGVLKIVIKESYTSGLLSDGGSSLRVELYSNASRMVCPVRDYSNGTYLSCCTTDMSTMPTIYTVDIYLQFIKLQSFERLKSQNKLIWHKTFANTKRMVNGNSTSIGPQYSNCSNLSELNLSTGYWLTVDNSYRYVLPDQSCVVPPVMVEEFRGCIDAQYAGRIHVMGDSHMRYLFQYIMQHLYTNYTIPIGLSTAELQQDFIFGHHNFWWTTVCSTHVSKLELFLQYLGETRVNGTEEDPQMELLITDGGVWDLVANENDATMIVLRCARDQLLLLYKKILAYKNVRVIWHEMPPLPGSHPSAGDTGKRNSFMINALNYCISTMYKNIGIQVVPTWTLAIAWSEELVQGGTHLLTTSGNRFLMTPPGGVANHVTMHYVCGS